MIDQLTVFLENDTGHLAALCRALGAANISMRALTVADTARYGVARIITDEPTRAYEVLNQQGFRASLTKVFAIEVDDAAGGLVALLDAFEAAEINVEYAYCFSTSGGKAIDVLSLDSLTDVEAVFAAAGYRSMKAEELSA
jgi:hypothetical protein